MITLTSKARVRELCTSSREIFAGGSSRHVLPTRPSVQDNNRSATNILLNTAFSTRRCAAPDCCTTEHSARCENDAHARVPARKLVCRLEQPRVIVGIAMPSRIPHHESTTISLCSRPHLPLRDPRLQTIDHRPIIVMLARKAGARAGLYLHPGSAGTRTVGRPLLTVGSSFHDLISAADERGFRTRGRFDS
jgi:hypothetical protein